MKPVAHRGRPGRRRYAVVLGVVGALLIVLSTAAVAGAHNSLAGSDPADGAVLAAAPTQVVLFFASPAPLDTASVELIDVSGNRTPIESLGHGPGGDSEIVAPIPESVGGSLAGAVTVRWRLVGPDGHPVTGRVGLTVAGQDGAGADTLATGPPGAAVEPAAVAGEPGRAGDLFRWLVRWAAYAALAVLIGLVSAGAWLMPSSWRALRVRAAALGAGALVGVLGVVQLLQLAGDIGGRSSLGAWSDLGSALRTSVGLALAVRVMASVALVVVLAGPRARRGRRWPVIGVPVDVVHHAAAAVWLGGLAVVGRLALGSRSAESLVPPVQRFTRLAPVAVGVLVVTGIVQSLRLTGMPDLSFGSTHTNLLVGKVVVLGAMLVVADVNRKRVARRFRTPDQVRPGAVWALRRAMVVELCLGLVIVALTAALVVSSPPVATATGGGGDEIGLSGRAT